MDDPSNVYVPDIRDRDTRIALMMGLETLEAIANGVGPYDVEQDWDDAEWFFATASFDLYGMTGEGVSDAD